MREPPEVTSLLFPLFAMRMDTAGDYHHLYEYKYGGPKSAKKQYHDNGAELGKHLYGQFGLKRAVQTSQKKLTWSYLYEASYAVLRSWHVRTFHLVLSWPYMYCKTNMRHQPPKKPIISCWVEEKKNFFWKESWIRWREIEEEQKFYFGQNESFKQSMCTYKRINMSSYAIHNKTLHDDQG